MIRLRIYRDGSLGSTTIATSQNDGLVLAAAGHSGVAQTALADPTSLF